LKIRIYKYIDDLTQILILDSDYTVTDAGNPNGGTIILTTAASVNDIITITRVEAIERISQYQSGGLFKADDVNTDFNQGILYNQQNAAQFDARGLYYQWSEIIEEKEQKLPKLPPNHLWKKNSDDTGIIPVEFEESEGWGTLRSELANEDKGTDGARLIGYNDPTETKTTVKDQLDNYQSDITQINDEIADIKKAVHNTGITTGTEPDYEVTIDSDITAYTLGLDLLIKFHAPNTGTPTLNVNGVGEKAIKKYNLETPINGEIRLNAWYRLVFDTDSDAFIFSNIGFASDDALGISRFATGTDIKNQSDELAFVNPKRLINHPLVPKATATFKAESGVVTIYNSANIASIVHVSASIYTITLTYEMSDVHYGIILQHEGASLVIIQNKTATSFEINGAFDGSLIIFGNLAATIE
jgi:hypothetical protein